MTRADMPPDPASVIGALRACREAMLQVQGRVRATGPVYHGAAMVIASIDGFATLLTGQRYFFSVDGSVAAAPHNAQMQDQAPRQSGEGPVE